jgi:predicted translin family RNA/ssDNA-binding protein
MVVDKKIFAKIRKEIVDRDALREQLIIESRPIIKSAKQAIYALHRDDIKEAKENLDQGKKDIEKLKKIVKKDPTLEYGSYSAALQEYAEAITYYYYMTEDRLVDNEELGIDGENYLLGLCDLTGELARRAVFSVVNERYSEVKKIKDFVSVIHDEFLEFELRNGELRKKSDSIKWNLKKIEETLYDLKIRDKI